MISTRDFSGSTTLQQASGNVPNPRYGTPRPVLISTTPLIWCGRTDFSDQSAQNRSNDDSHYPVNLVSREWTRIVVNVPGPGGRYYHTMALVSVSSSSPSVACPSRVFLVRSNPFWELYEPTPGSRKPLPRAGQVRVTTTDRIIIFGGGESLDDGSQITYVSSINGTPTKDIHNVTDEDGSMTCTGGWNEPSPLIVAQSIFVSKY